MCGRPLHHKASGPAAFFLVGPTGMGKTAVSQVLAESEGCDILSADSMLVYRGMDIGTAKPTREEQSRVSYWGIDLVTPETPFSVGAWYRHAGQAIAETRKAGRKLIVTGGTGLYIKSLTHGLDDLPPAREDIRRRAEDLYDRQGLSGLQEQLRRLDPEHYERVRDKNNPRRLIRAIELAEQGAPAVRSWEAGSAERPLPPDQVSCPDRGRDGFPADSRNHPASLSSHPLIGLISDMEDLYTEIGKRARRMFKEGLLDEIKVLTDTYPKLSETAREAIGYREGMGVLEGRITVPEAIEQTAMRTRRLAKRQMTWFRHQAHVHWIRINPGTSRREVAEHVRKIWSVHGPTPLAH